MQKQKFEGVSQNSQRRESILGGPSAIDPKELKLPRWNPKVEQER